MTPRTIAIEKEIKIYPKTCLILFGFVKIRLYKMSISRWFYYNVSSEKKPVRVVPRSIKHREIHSDKWHFWSRGIWRGGRYRYSKKNLPQTKLASKNLPLLHILTVIYPVLKSQNGVLGKKITVKSWDPLDYLWFWLVSDLEVMKIHQWKIPRSIFINTIHNNNAHRKYNCFWNCTKTLQLKTRHIHQQVTISSI